MSISTYKEADALRKFYGVIADHIDLHLSKHDVLKDVLKEDILRDLGLTSPSVLIDDEDKMFFGSKQIDLSNQPLMKKLFETFIGMYRCRIGREALVEAIYSRDLDVASRRRLMCDYHNIVKLVSRARNLAKQHLDDPDNPSWDWFPYDSTSEQWVLMRPRATLH